MKQLELSGACYNTKFLFTRCLIFFFNSFVLYISSYLRCAMVASGFDNATRWLFEQYVNA